MVIFLFEKKGFKKKYKVKEKNVSLHLGGQWILVEVNWLLFVQNNWLQTHHDCSERSKRKGSSFSSLSLKMNFLKLCSRVIVVSVSLYIIIGTFFKSVPVICKNYLPKTTTETH